MKPKTAVITAVIALAVYLGVEKYKASSGKGTTRSPL